MAMTGPIATISFSPPRAASVKKLTVEAAPRGEPQTPAAVSPRRAPLPPTSSPLGRRPAPRPWCLPARGLAVFHGPDSTPRLSHYFLPRLLAEGKRVLMLDGANSADPRLIARFARERGVEFLEFSRRIQIARAFTCFQLTELIRRVPQFLRDFSAEVVMVTALPDLYFDEDVRDQEARVAFDRALAGLRCCCSGGVPAAGDTGATAPLSVAIFSAATRFAPSPARRQFFARVCASAAEVWTFSAGENGRPKLLLSSPSSGEMNH